MEAIMNFLELNELEVGEKFIIIHTGDRNERERLDSQKEVYIKTAQSHKDNSPQRGENAVKLTDGEPSQVEHTTPVIRITI